MRLGQGGIQIDRATEQPLRFTVVISRPFVEMLGAEAKEVPRIECPRRLSVRPGSFRVSDLRFEPGGDHRRDFVLHLEYFVKPAVILLRPDLLSALRLHELRRDAHALPDSADTALNKVTGSQVEPDAAHIAALSF